MHEILKTKIKEYSENKVDQYNYLREYLQLLILKIMDERGFFRSIAFVGGTALRILYDLNRFSEDLDFSLLEKNFNLVDMLNTIKGELLQRNFQIDMLVKDQKTVASALIKFNKILPELGLSPHASQKLTIKLEIDRNPPKGFQTQFTMINKEFLIGINHYDLPSLFAGKLHAILCRSYTKGRDYYDLIWFLSKKIEPNYPLLRAAIAQTEQKELNLNQESTQTLLKDAIQKADFKKIRQDIEPFLADNKELRYFDKDFFTRLLK